jgi:hypothetical protein
MGNSRSRLEANGLNQERWGNERAGEGLGTFLPRRDPVMVPLFLPTNAGEPPRITGFDPGARSSF